MIETEQSQQSHQNHQSLQNQRAHYDAYSRNVIPVQYRPVQAVQIANPNQYYNNQHHRQQQQSQSPYRKEPVGSKISETDDKDEEEKEEPDRLTLLLAQSKFNCVSKNTGYYADEELSCEVFHYCQDGAKHSWICPEGFTFHQVHLICMPPGADNICDKSSQYHFVNDYLYKPINLEEHQAKPNISLKYSERYYPEPYNNYANEEEYQVEQRHYQPAKKPIQVGFNNQQAHPSVQSQVFRSPEEVNISLQQRRPAYLTQRYRTE